jgi:hydrogenase expression/formation protein HypD
VRYVDEYRDVGRVQRWAAILARQATRPWTLMEVCGGQTHSIVRFGIDRLLPPGVELVHGPGCPVCVTPLAAIERALELAADPHVILCSFGDMLRVPGKARDLRAVRAAGGDVRVVYSPVDALRVASAHPEREVVFFAVGFETTAPATALAAVRARELGIRNFSLLVAHVLVPPALAALLGSPDNRIQGLLAPGHVCAITGVEAYAALARRYGVPIVVTGFEPVDLLQGLVHCVRQLERGRAVVENPYRRAVRLAGNRAAQALVSEVYEVVPRSWRGLGEIPGSGLRLRAEWSDFDAERRFGPVPALVEEDSGCASGLVLRGALRPDACAAFGTVCTPEHPLGAPMVSSEGACAAYYTYRRTG